jgi:large subunit ribosomal protein L13
VRRRGIQKTSHVKGGEVEQRWWVVDATGKVLGRLATRLATVLQGKHKPAYSPHIDTGDFVIVTNASKVRLTGGKRETKEYRHYTGYLSGLRTEKAGRLLDRRPEKVMELAVRRMLPKGRLGRSMLKKLKIFGGAEHPHAAQKPEPLV